MPIIDAHVHLYPPEVNSDPTAWAAAAEEFRWAVMHTRVRKNGRPVQSFPLVKGLLQAMDEAGVERAVLLGWYWERAASCRMQNRFYAECIRAHPDRLSAFATVSFSEGARVALEELKRAHDNGFCGVGELSPHSVDWPLSDETLHAVLASAGEWGMPVNLHVTEPESRDYPGKVATPLIDFLNLARAYPETDFILAHWGGRLPLVTDEALPTNLWYDTAATPLLYDHTIWRKFVAKVGAERVLFGSDFSLNLYPAIDAEPNMTRLVAEVHRSELPAESLKAIVCDNAERVLRLRMQ